MEKTHKSTVDIDKVKKAAGCGDTSCEDDFHITDDITSNKSLKYLQTSLRQKSISNGEGMKSNKNSQNNSTNYSGNNTSNNSSNNNSHNNSINSSSSSSHSNSSSSGKTFYSSNSSKKKKNTNNNNNNNSLPMAQRTRQPQQQQQPQQQPQQQQQQQKQDQNQNSNAQNHKSQNNGKHNQQKQRQSSPQAPAAAVATSKASSVSRLSTSSSSSGSSTTSTMKLSNGGSALHNGSAKTSRSNDPIKSIANDEQDALPQTTVAASAAVTVAAAVVATPTSVTTISTTKSAARGSKSAGSVRPGAAASLAAAAVAALAASASKTAGGTKALAKLSTQNRFPGSTHALLMTTTSTVTSAPSAAAALTAALQVAAPDDSTKTYMMRPSIMHAALVSTSAAAATPADSVTALQTLAGAAKASLSTTSLSTCKSLTFSQSSGTGSSILSMLAAAAAASAIDVQDAGSNGSQEADQQLTSSNSNIVIVYNGGFHSKYHFTIPPDILDDLASRFIINVPDIELQNLIRICFQIELAHWFYLDFYCPNEEEDKTKLHPCGMKQFAMQIFQHIPFLREHLPGVDTILEDWKNYKMAVPTYGAILISEDLNFCLLVQSYFAKSSWGFPKGKINEHEDPVHCATREVYEETGFDITDLIVPNEFIEAVINYQHTRLYIVVDVPLETQFVPRTRNEIKCCEWFPIDSLPANKSDNNTKLKLGINANSFFMIMPFVKRLKRWVHERRLDYAMATAHAIAIHASPVSASSSTSSLTVMQRHGASTMPLAICAPPASVETGGSMSPPTASDSQAQPPPNKRHLNVAQRISSKKNKNKSCYSVAVERAQANGEQTCTFIPSAVYSATGGGNATASGDNLSRRQRHKSMGDLDGARAQPSARKPQNRNEAAAGGAQASKRQLFHSQSHNGNAKPDDAVQNAGAPNAQHKTKQKPEEPRPRPKPAVDDAVAKTEKPEKSEKPEKLEKPDGKPAQPRSKSARKANNAAGSSGDNATAAVAAAPATVPAAAEAEVAADVVESKSSHESGSGGASAGSVADSRRETAMKNLQQKITMVISNSKTKIGGILHVSPSTMLKIRTPSPGAKPCDEDEDKPQEQRRKHKEMQVLEKHKRERIKYLRSHNFHQRSKNPNKSSHHHHENQMPIQSSNQSLPPTNEVPKPQAPIHQPPDPDKPQLITLYHKGIKQYNEKATTLISNASRQLSPVRNPKAPSSYQLFNCEPDEELDSTQSRPLKNYMFTTKQQRYFYNNYKQIYGHRNRCGQQTPRTPPNATTHFALPASTSSPPPSVMQELQRFNNEKTLHLLKPRQMHAPTPPDTSSAPSTSDEEEPADQFDTSPIAAAMLWRKLAEDEQKELQRPEAEPPEQAQQPPQVQAQQLKAQQLEAQQFQAQQFQAQQLEAQQFQAQQLQAQQLEAQQLQAQQLQAQQLQALQLQAQQLQAQQLQAQLVAAPYQAHQLQHVHQLQQLPTPTRVRDLQQIEQEQIQQQLRQMALQQQMQQKMKPDPLHGSPLHDLQQIELEQRQRQHQLQFSAIPSGHNGTHSPFTPGTIASPSAKMLAMPSFPKISPSSSSLGAASLPLGWHQPQVLLQPQPQLPPVRLLNLEEIEREQMGEGRRMRELPTPQFVLQESDLLELQRRHQQKLRQMRDHSPPRTELMKLLEIDAEQQVIAEREQRARELQARLHMEQLSLLQQDASMQQQYQHLYELECNSFPSISQSYKEEGDVAVETVATDAAGAVALAVAGNDAAANAAAGAYAGVGGAVLNTETLQEMPEAGEDEPDLSAWTNFTFRRGFLSDIFC